uniref:beta-glucosidase n=1 Tax=Bigelowiella natans TaxID=227086 RepID=A0A7S2KPX3_BIGNA
MPDGDFFGAPLRKRVAVLEQHADDDDDHDDNARAFTSTSKLNKTDAISGKMIERSVLRILTQMYKVGVMADSKDGKTAFDVFSNPDKINRNVTRPEHVDLARRMAADSTILLKNDKQALPLPKRVHEGERKTLEDHGKKPTIAVVGRCAHSKPLIVGGGSAIVKADPKNIVTPYLGIRRKAGESYSVVLVDSDDAKEATAQLQTIMPEYVVIAVGVYSEEGTDRKNLSLAKGHDILISHVAQHQRRHNPAASIVVAASVPGAILTPWSSDVSAVLVNFFPGQEYGNALADVLFGDISPSAKLPLTFPNEENEPKFSLQAYPGVRNTSVYEEELVIGYRWYEKHQVSPKFPFGFGMSYTTFQYGGLTVTPPNGEGKRQEKAIVSLLRSDEQDQVALSVQFSVKNVGARAGAEVSQLYLRFPEEVGEPPKQLKGFERVFLQPGKAEDIEIRLTKRDVSIFSETAHSWQIVRGKFEVMVGASSKDIKLRANIVL